MHEIEKNVVNTLNDKSLLEEYAAWNLLNENLDFEMVKNIYKYSNTYDYNKAVFLVGAEHRKSILKKSKNIIKTKQ